MDRRFLKGLNPEFACPATANFADSDPVQFVAVFKRPSAAERDQLNIELMQTLQTSLSLREQLNANQLTIPEFASKTAANNQALTNLVGANLLRCEDLKYGDGVAVEWSAEVYQQMQASHEYSAALAVALRTMASGQAIEQVVEKNSVTSATPTTEAGATLPVVNA